VAAFAEPDRKNARLGKAMQWVARALACAKSTPELTLPAVPHIDQLWKLVEREMSEPAGAAPPPSALPLVVPAPEADPASPREEPSPPAIADAPSLLPAANDAVAAAHLSRLEMLYWRRQDIARDPAATWAELAAVEADIRRAVVGLGWIGEAAAKAATVALDAAEDPDSSFAASLALLALDRHNGERILSWMARQSVPGAALDGATLALRMGAGEAMDEVAEAWRASEPRVKAALLPLLADCDRITADVLVELLDHPATEVADAAAALLAWLDDGGHRSLVETRALDGARASFLQAAVALGSVAALRAVRAAVDSDEPDLATHVETLAFAGDPSDRARLDRLAAREGPDAALAALVISHLGLGDDRPVRLLRGEPWTIAGALSRLAAADEPLQRRRWHAREATVRSGVRPAVVYDCGSPAATQQQVAERLRAAFADQRQLPPGRWCYFGRNSV
jgi:hypothetical protein